MINFEITGAIQSDNEAEELIVKLKQHEAERARLIEVCNAMIKNYADKISDINYRFDEAKAFPVSMLGEYAKDKANDCTKTMRRYSLPSAKLVWKKQNAEYVRDEKFFAEFIDKNFPEYIKVKTTKSADWATIKSKVIELEDGSLALQKGDKIIPLDGVKIVERPDVFMIEGDD